MTDDPTDTKAGDPDETQLLRLQSLKYAEDIVKVYEEEKNRRAELEDANQKLRIEIDERKRAQEALSASEARFRAIFETAQDCVYIKDRALKYTLVNPAMESLFQIPGDQMVGRDDEDLYGIEIGVHLKALDARVLSGESIEKEHTREVQGVSMTFLETKVPLRDRDGEIVGLCGIARNVTERQSIRLTPHQKAPEYPSQSMRATLKKAGLIALQDSIVLLMGESGCGKDWLAAYIHDHSERRNGPFFTINCASVAPELAESELFGHEAGAFTGARARKRGLLELAEGGSLFLNEVGELPPTLQAKLLTFLDTRAFTRIGGEKTITVDARLIAATNRDLESEVNAGRFRQDLFFRLNVLSIRIPSLRERRKDIPILAGQILNSLSQDVRLSAPPVLDPQAVEALKSHEWPGNVRELRNILERALILSGGGKMTAAHLGLAESSQNWRFVTNFPEEQSLNDITRELKKSLIVEALYRTGGKKSAAARLLHISRNSLNHYLVKLGINA